MLEDAVQKLQVPLRQLYERIQFPSSVQINTMHGIILPSMAENVFELVLGEDSNAPAKPFDIPPTAAQRISLEPFAIVPPIAAGQYRHKESKKLILTFTDANSCFLVCYANLRSGLVVLKRRARGSAGSRQDSGCPTSAKALRKPLPLVLHQPTARTPTPRQSPSPLSHPRQPSGSR